MQNYDLCVLNDSILNYYELLTTFMSFPKLLVLVSGVNYRLPRKQEFF